MEISKPPKQIGTRKYIHNTFYPTDDSPKGILVSHDADTWLEVLMIDFLVRGVRVTLDGVTKLMMLETTYNGIGGAYADLNSTALCGYISNYEMTMNHVEVVDGKEHKVFKYKYSYGSVVPSVSLDVSRANAVLNMNYEITQSGHGTRHPSFTRYYDTTDEHCYVESNYFSAAITNHMGVCTFMFDVDTKFYMKHEDGRLSMKYTYLGNEVHSTPITADISDVTFYDGACRVTKPRCIMEDSWMVFEPTARPVVQGGNNPELLKFALAHKVQSMFRTKKRKAEKAKEAERSRRRID